MRMFGISPSLRCDNHLYGEHGEIHKHKHNFEKHHKVDGRIYPIVLIEPSTMKIWHDMLAEEIDKRAKTKKSKGHNSPHTQPDISYLPFDQQFARVDIEYNIKDLAGRCPECRERLINAGLYEDRVV